MGNGDQDLFLNEDLVDLALILDIFLLNDFEGEDHIVFFTTHETDLAIGSFSDYRD